MFRVSIQAEGMEPRQMEFDQQEITIGRLSSADIQLKANNISKQHSRIVYREGRYFIIDRKSTNGTFVNGNRVSVPISLKTGDKIFIGDFVLEFEAPNEGSAQPAKPVPVPPPLPPVAGMPPVTLEADQTEPPRAAQPPAIPGEDLSLDGSDVLVMEDDGQPQPEELFREFCLDLYVATGDFEEFEDIEAFLDYRLDDDTLVTTIAKKLNDMAEEMAPEWLSEARRDAAVDHVLRELLGYGALEDLLEDDEIEQVFINGPETLVVEMGGTRELISGFFTCEEALYTVMVRLLKPYNVILNEDTTILNAVTPEFAVNGVLHPFAANGSTLVLKKTPVYQETMTSLVEGGVLTQEMADFLVSALGEGKTIAVTGLREEDRMNVLAALSLLISPRARVAGFNLGASIELPHADKVIVETVAGDRQESELMIDPGDLMRHLSRMNADHLVVREVEESFALDLLMALDSGLSGSLFSIYGKSCKDALIRLRRMAGYHDEAGRAYVSELIGATVGVVVKIRTYENGESRVNCICEVSPDDDGWELTRRFTFKASTDTEDKLIGEFVRLKD